MEAKAFSPDAICFKVKFLPSPNREIFPLAHSTVFTPVYIELKSFNKDESLALQTAAKLCIKYQ